MGVHLLNLTLSNQQVNLLKDEIIQKLKLKPIQGNQIEVLSSRNVEGE